MSLLTRRWMDAVWSACFAVHLILDRFFPTVTWQVTYAFAVIGAVLVVSQVLEEYDRYKKGLVVR